MNLSTYLNKLRSFSRDAWLYVLTFALWGAYFGINGVLLNLYLTRLGQFRTILLATVGTVLCLLLLALVPHWAAASLGYVGLMALNLIGGPALGVYSQERVPPRSRSLLTGATTLAGGLSNSAMAWGGGYLITAGGFPSLFATAAALTACAALVLGTALREPRGTQVRGPAAEGQPAG